jgi:single-strand DNA-binding protein
MPSDSYKLSGKIEAILPPREGGGKKFQTVVFRTEGQYPQCIPVEFGEKSIQHIERLRVGDEAECEFSLRGREWNGKYFANLSGFKIFGGGQPHQRGSSVNNERRPAQKDYPLKDRQDTVPDWNDQSEAPF